MTSSVGRKPNLRRRFFWLTVVVAVVFGGYSAAWFYAAGWLEKFATGQIANFNQSGRNLDCGTPTARGFPFHLGLYCDGLRFADPGSQVAASAAAFRSLADVYNPFQVLAELDSPATISAPGAGAIGFDWDRMRASALLATDFPDHADALVDKLAAARQGSTDKLASLEHGEAHMRQNGADLDLAATLDGAAIDPQLANGARLPPLRADVDVTIKDGVAWARSGGRSLRGHSGTIRTLSLSTSATTGLAVAGTFAVGEDGLLDADLQLTVRDPKGLGAQLAEAFPADADKFRTAMSGLAAMGDNPSLPLKVKHGKAVLGFLPLGDVPPL